jgi:hypothetical protein
MTNYNIKQYSYNQAKRLGVNIFPSKKANKKIDIYKDDVYVCSIGDKGMMDYPSYIINDGKKYANERRRLYHIRHKSDNKVGTKGWYALNILW